MEEQKKEIIQFVKSQKVKGCKITKTLGDIKVKRSTYYSWLRPKDNKKANPRITELIPEEKQIIEKIKEEYPHLRHRQIQGILQQKGMYLSFSSVYQHLNVELDHMEMVKDNCSIRQVGTYSFDICRGHIDCNGLYPCPGTVQPFPERKERVRSFSVTKEYYGTTFKIKDNSEICIPLLYCNLINGKRMNIFQAGT